MMKRIFFLLVLAMMTSASESLQAQNKRGMGAYLMVYHKDADHSLHMALSRDGFNWTALNGDAPIVRGDTIALQRGIRDPHIYRGPDGDYYIAATDLHIFGQRAGYRDTEWERDGKKYGWGNNRALVLMKSHDLDHYCCCMDYEQQTYAFVREIPTFEEVVGEKPEDASTNKCEKMP